MVVSHLTSLNPSFFNSKNFLCNYFRGKNELGSTIKHPCWPRPAQPSCDSCSVNSCSCLHPSCVTSGLQPSKFALCHSPCCTHPSLRICPRPHGQCPNLIWSALFTLFPASQLGLGCASQRPPQPTVSTWLHPIHVKSSFEDQPNPHILCSFPACFIHIRPELTKECTDLITETHTIWNSKIVPSPQIHQSYRNVLQWGLPRWTPEHKTYVNNYKCHQSTQEFKEGTKKPLN